MNILICPDSFKESLSAIDAAEAINKGVLKIFPKADCKMIPMADGGEGTMDAIIRATGGTIIRAKVHDPLMREIQSVFGLINKGKTAIIEMASASGLALLNPEEKNPLKTTTYGVGELIKQALDLGIREIIIGLGGSATVDAGVGMAQALGVKFITTAGKEIDYGGESIGMVAGIDMSGLDTRIKHCKISSACDVTNRLTGKQGAAMVYGPQKGASVKTAIQLDANLLHLSEVISQCLNVNVANIPCAGAAGGLGAGLKAFLNADLKSGFELISNLVKLKSWIQWADLVVTGEGRMDYQTAFGKAPAGVAQICFSYKKPVIAFTGSLGKGYEKLLESLFYSIIPITDNPMSLQHAINQAHRLLQEASERTFGLIKIGGMVNK